MVPPSLTQVLREVEKIHNDIVKWADAIEQNNPTSANNIVSVLESYHEVGSIRIPTNAFERVAYIGRSMMAGNIPEPIFDRVSYGFLNTVSTFSEINRKISVSNNILREGKVLTVAANEFNMTTVGIVLKPAQGAQQPEVPVQVPEVLLPGRMFDLPVGTRIVSINSRVQPLFNSRFVRHGYVLITDDYTISLEQAYAKVIRVAQPPTTVVTPCAMRGEIFLLCCDSAGLINSKTPLNSTFIPPNLNE